VTVNSINKQIKTSRFAKAKRILHVAESIFSTLFIITILLMLVLEVCGVLTIAVVSTDSMEPTIPPGSIAFFLHYDQYGVGDVIAFRVYNNLMMHRINETSSTGFFTKGDANENRDPWRVPSSAIKGRLILSFPLLGYALTLLRAPLFFAGLMTIIFIYSTKDWFFGNEPPQNGKTLDGKKDKKTVS